MKVSDLAFSYPEELVATSPVRPSRVMWVQGANPQEISLQQLLQKIPAGDVLVVNNTRVLKRRVFSEGLEILFLQSHADNVWDVLFPSKKMAIGETVPLPLGAKMTLLEKGRPQKVRVDQKLTDGYFEQVAELPLPPYIQKARKERHTVNEDANWYQTAWAKEPGSMAAPTASLHFSAQDLHALRARGVHIVELTLHVGLGTFLPVTSEDLNDHVMHEEYVQIPKATWQAVRVAQKENRGIWAMGTTVARSLESTANGKLPEFEGGFRGLTNLLIQPGYPWQIVNRLLTNFHQPESTLLALVASFSDLNTVKASYSWAMERKFRLFSYGDLSVWIK